MLMTARMTDPRIRRRRSNGRAQLKRRLAADRRRVAHDAARAVRVPGPAGHREVPAREARRGAPLRLVATRANGQSAFGCYLDDAQAPIARALRADGAHLHRRAHLGDHVVFGERSLLVNLGLPRTIREE